jgi:hypothetical protein
MIRAAIFALSSTMLGACAYSHGEGAIPSQAQTSSFVRVPQALHFVPFVATCVQSGSTCTGGKIQSLAGTGTISAGISYPYALQSDNHGNLYVANLLGNTVTVYAPGRARPKLTIRPRVSSPDALAFDESSGNLYVANNCTILGSSGACSNPNTVSAYHHGRYALSITQSVNQPVALALDGSGDLFVANAGSNTVTEYAADSHSLIRTISAGVKGPTALAISPITGDLYVANNQGDDVTVYTARATHPTRTVIVPQPYRLAIDNDGDLYVGTPSLVLIYCRPCNKPSRVINHQAVVALAIDESNRYLYVANGGLLYTKQNVQLYLPGSTSPSKTWPITQTVSALALQPASQ